MALSPTSSRGGGGGSAVITRATYDLTTTAIPASAVTKIPLAFNYGTALLDLTSPTNPTPVASGVYAWCVSVAASDIVGASILNVVLTVDEDDFAATSTTYGAITSAGASYVVPLTFYVPAGSPCYVTARSDDTGGATIAGSVQLQRLS